MKTNVRLKYLLHRFHFLAALVIIALAVVVSIWLAIRGEDWKIFLPVVAGAVSLIYIIEKQQLEEAVLFKQLFTELNKKYDDLNEKLNGIVADSSDVLSQAQKNDLYDYFNLCGEEYLFYLSGYIYPRVWKSWVKGMEIFYSVPKIRKEWDRELETASYYGLNVAEQIRLVDGRSFD